MREKKKFERTLKMNNSLLFHVSLLKKQKIYIIFSNYYYNNQNARKKKLIYVCECTHRHSKV